MARITHFEESTARSAIHPTEVECGWQVISKGEARYLQLSTYGSASRASGPKVSQTIQLDETAARELMAILKRAFPKL